MLLLDTSVWIDLLNRRDTDAVRFVLRQADTQDLALTEMIYQEVLQGIASAPVLERVKQVLSGQEVLQPLQGLASYEAAARHYALARSRGITIRSSIDCLIAQIALEHEALLVHNDRDYFQLQGMLPSLQLFPSRSVH